MTASENEFIGPPIHKNAHEELRVSLNEYNGHQLVNLRVFFERDGQSLPGKQGVALRVNALPELIEILQEARAVAVRKGLLSGQGGAR